MANLDRQKTVPWKKNWPLLNVLHYANAAPTETSWRDVVLGLQRREIIGKGTWPKELPPFGVPSFQECQEILSRFREFVVAATKLKSPTSIEAIEFATELHNRAKLKPERFGFDSRTLQLQQRWETEKSSFEEGLYAFLAFALREVPYSYLHVCENCPTIFVSDSKRDLKYCSPRCRNQALVRRHRERARRVASKRPKPRTP